MTLFLPGMDDDIQPLLATAASATRSWCDPCQYDEIVGIDFGANSICYYMARSRRAGEVSLPSFKSWLFGLPRNTLAVSEWAHLAVPRTSRSLAQPYTAEELSDIYCGCRQRGITLKLAPHAHTGMRMRAAVSHRHPELIVDNKKTDAADAIALAVFVSEINDVSLANPPATFERHPGRDYGREVTARSNVVLNAERTCKYRGNYFPLLIELAREVRKKSGCKPKVAISVVSTLACEQGEQIYLFTHHGKVPGRRFWMRHVLRFSPWHHRGGIARSNLMWHLFRPYMARFGIRHGVRLRKGQKYKPVALMSDKEKAVRTAALRSFRQTLLVARDVCIEKALKMGAGTLELTHAGEEVTSGR